MNGDIKVKKYALQISFIILMMMSCSLVYAERILKPGMAGNDVYLLQLKLKEYGFYEGELDQVFGNGTLAAVQSFQRATGLDPDGVAGGQTLYALHDYKKNVSRGIVAKTREHEVSNFALKHSGIPYVWGGSSPTGFDCSGFIYYIYNHFGIQLPRAADEQFQVGNVVNGSLKIGDLVFFSTYEPGPSHVGIYIGNGEFIHASSAAEQVTITSLSKPYYQSRFLGARRIF